MRILAGQYKGRTLKLPRGLRSTSDKVRAAVFNIVADAIAGSRFLDVCAGSGAIGLEALSRGAASVTWIEQHKACCVILRENLRRMAGERPAQPCAILCHDALEGLRKLGRSGAQFDLIFLDPPYRDISLLKKALQAISHHAILPDTGWLIVEHERHCTVPQLVDTIEVVSQYPYGDTALSLCRRRQPFAAGPQSCQPPEFP